MAVPTAAGILLLVAAGLVLAPGEGIIAVVLRPSAGGRLLRRLLPVVVLVPTAFLIPIGRGADRGLYGFDVGVLLFLIGTMAVSLPVVFWTARSLDVAETRAGQEAERFASVLRAATEQSIIGMDVDGVITVFNEGAERMLSYTAEEVVGRETLQLIHDPREVAARARELGVAPGFEVFVAAARRNLAETREWTFVRKDGGRTPVSLTVTAMLASDGSQEGFMGVAFDLSARKELERELRRQADFTGTLVGSAPVGIFATDESGACIFVNSKWRELTGLSGEDAHGDGWLRAVHPDDAPQVSHAWEALVVDDTSFAVEYRFRRPDESVVWVASSAVALRNEHGEAEGYLGTVLDLTQRRVAEAERERLLAQSRAVLDAATDGILMTDLRGEVLFSNAAMEAFWAEIGVGGLGTIWDRVDRLSRLTTSSDAYQQLLEAVARDPEGEHVGEFTLAESGRSFVGLDRVGARCGRRADGADLLAPRDDTRTRRRASEGRVRRDRLPRAQDTPRGHHRVRRAAGGRPRAARRRQHAAPRGRPAQRGQARPTRRRPPAPPAVRDRRGVGEPGRRRPRRGAGPQPGASRARRDSQVDRDRPRGRGRAGPPRGRHAHRAGARQPPLERGEVHAGGRVDRGARRPWGRCVRHRSGGLGAGHPGRRARAAVRAVLPQSRRDRESDPGTGLGLAVSRRIAEAHGGSLELVDGKGPGATFRLVVPLAQPASHYPALKAVARHADTPIE